MQLQTSYKSSSFSGPIGQGVPHLSCSNENIVLLVDACLETMNCKVEDIINIETHGPYGAGEWGVRVFCRTA